MTTKISDIIWPLIVIVFIKNELPCILGAWSNSKKNLEKKRVIITQIDTKFLSPCYYSL